jgi:uncharacterized protein YsxB (DUF464 family)
VYYKQSTIVTNNLGAIISTVLNWLENFASIEVTVKGNGLTLYIPVLNLAYNYVLARSFFADEFLFAKTDAL